MEEGCALNPGALGCEMLRPIRVGQDGQERTRCSRQKLILDLELRRIHRLGV